MREEEPPWFSETPGECGEFRPCILGSSGDKQVLACGLENSVAGAFLVVFSLLLCCVTSVFSGSAAESTPGFEGVVLPRGRQGETLFSFA